MQKLSDFTGSVLRIWDERSDDAIRLVRTYKPSCPNKKGSVVDIGNPANHFQKFVFCQDAYNVVAIRCVHASNRLQTSLRNVLDRLLPRAITCLILLTVQGDD